MITSYTFGVHVLTTFLANNLFCFFTVSIAIRCQQFGNTLMLDTIPAVAEKLWSDYILTVCVIIM